METRQEKLQRAEAARNAPSRFSAQQLEQLRQLEHERVQVDRERKLGVKSKPDVGVRYEDRML